MPLIMVAGKKNAFTGQQNGMKMIMLSNPLVFSGTGFITTDYTAGKKNAFRTPKVLIQPSKRQLEYPFHLVDYLGMEQQVPQQF